MERAIAAIAVKPARDWGEHAGGLLQQLRQRRARVHAITNAAAQVLTANLLLAAGAIPSLTISPEEVAAFTARADALLINLGTLDADRGAAIPAAIAKARETGKPWLLDPVFVETSPPRLDLARSCLGEKPAVVRCNGPEFEALSGMRVSAVAVGRFAAAHGCVVALTGPTDLVTDGERFVGIENGHPLMARVTAMGCAATALVAAFKALEPDGLVAAVSALLVVGVAGEIAAKTAAGPGTFQPALLDALDALDATCLAARARTS